MTEPKKDPAAFVKGLDRAEQVVIGCCVLAALLCFVPWYSMEVPKEFKMLGGKGASSSGFDSWHGILVFLLSLASAAAVWAEKSDAVQIARSNARLAALAGSAMSALITIIYIASAEGQEMMGMKAGKTLWPFVVLVATGAAAWFAFTRLGAGSPAPTDAS